MNEDEIRTLDQDFNYKNYGYFYEKIEDEKEQRNNKEDSNGRDVY